jgi:hypothetical protein
MTDSARPREARRNFAILAVIATLMSIAVVIATIAFYPE